jgi:hypothetical protein
MVYDREGNGQRLWNSSSRSLWRLGLDIGSQWSNLGVQRKGVFGLGSVDGNDL